MKNQEALRVFRKNLRFQMILHDKTRNQICDDLGIKYTTFANWFNGDFYPRIDKIELLAQYFGISKSDLIEDHDDFAELAKVDPDLAPAYELINRKSSSSTDEQSKYIAEVMRELKDCTDDERRLFLDVMRATKRSMRGNVDKKAP